MIHRVDGVPRNRSEQELISEAEAKPGYFLNIKPVNAGVSFILPFTDRHERFHTWHRNSPNWTSLPIPEPAIQGTLYHLPDWQAHIIAPVLGHLVHSQEWEAEPQLELD